MRFVGHICSTPVLLYVLMKTAITCVPTRRRGPYSSNRQWHIKIYRWGPDVNYHGKSTRTLSLTSKIHESFFSHFCCFSRGKNVSMIIIFRNYFIGTIEISFSIFIKIKYLYFQHNYNWCKCNFVPIYYYVVYYDYNNYHYCWINL